MRPAAFRLNELGIGLGMLAHCSRQAPFGGRVIAGGMNPGARSIDGGDHLAAGRAAGGHQCDQLRHDRESPAYRRAGRPAGPHRSQRLRQPHLDPDRVNTADAQPTSDGHEGVAPAQPVASRRSSSPRRIRAALRARPHHVNHPAAAARADLMNFLFNMVGDAVVVADPRLIGSGTRGCEDAPVGTTRLSAASPGPYWSSPARSGRLATYTTSRRAPCSLRLCGLGDSPSLENRRGGGDPVRVALPEAFPGVPPTSVSGAPEVGHMRPPRLVGVS